MNMKNIWLKSALMAVAGFSTVSCADFLDLTPEDLIVEDNYWNEKNDVDQVLTGCYTRMQDHDFLARAFVWGEVRADNVAGGDTRVGDNEYEILQENILSTNAYTSWTPFYAVINRCNLVIDRATKVAEKDPNFSDSQVRATIAEASGIRALCYFYLVRTFKSVPYYTYAITADDQTLTLPVTDGGEILNSLIEDLERVQGDASLKVLNGSRDVTCGRMNRVAIWALIADMCLWQQQYDKAIEYADRVIAYKNRFNPNSSNYDPATANASSSSVATGNEYLRCSYYVGTNEDGTERTDYFPLLEDDANVTINGIGRGISGRAFTSIFGDGLSMESIFELSFDGENENDNKKNNDMIDDFFRRYVKRNNIDAKAIGRFVASQEFADQFNLTSGAGNVFLPWKTTPSSDKALSTPDARFLESICFSGATKGNVSNGELVKYNWKTYYAYPTGGSNELYYATTPGAESTGRARTGIKNDANWIFYRVSDVMLIKAEAIACSDASRLKEAFNLVQAINDRSNTERDGGTSPVTSLSFENYNSSDVLNRLILDERRREFLFEGKRWFDLVRWSRRVGNTELLKQACISKMPQGATSGSGKLTNMEAIYFPYNKTELQTNPNLHQNPAYPEVDNDSYESTN